MENRNKQDGICSWCQLVQQGLGVMRQMAIENVRIKRLDNFINMLFHSDYMEGLVEWIQAYEDAFTEETELALLGQKNWNED
jgi:hypothetical protein